MKTNIEPLQADSYYHIYNRGINGENIFKKKETMPISCKNTRNL